jgi:murein DD-endopeptidase MepM/ murein hydrolase activator NlpD
VRVKPQSYLLPAALLICLFFCTSAYSQKKNSVYTEGADRGVKFNNENYKESAAEGDGDIISYNRKNYNTFHDDAYNRREVSAKASNIKNTSSKNSSGSFVYYAVKSGDTLFGIAKRSGVTVNQIQDLNNLNGSSKIYKGMKLKIPSSQLKSEKRASSAGSTGKSKPGFLWPLKKVKSYSQDGGNGVKSIGILIKGTPGGEVVASEDGVVKKVGYMRGYGNYIVVKHENRYITVYSNLLGIDVKAGDPVVKGCRIGKISDDMTLHFQIDREGKPENPVKLLPGRG